MDVERIAKGRYGVGSAHNLLQVVLTSRVVLKYVAMELELSPKGATMETEMARTDVAWTANR